MVKYMVDVKALSNRLHAAGIDDHSIFGDEWQLVVLGRRGDGAIKWIALFEWQSERTFRDVGIEW